MKFLTRLSLFLLLVLTGSAASLYKQQLIDEVLLITDARGALESLRQQNVLLTTAALNKEANGKDANHIYMRQLMARAMQKYEHYSKELFAWSRWEPKFSEHYDQHYTEAQLKALIAFMKTDAGQAMIKAQAGLSASLQQQLAEDRSHDAGRIDRIFRETIEEVTKEIAASDAKLATETVSEVEVKARAGDPVAQMTMGENYAGGKGVAKDPVEAIKWFRMAADQGDTDAMRALGEAYMKGEGFDQDPARARELFAKGAAGGDFNCMYLLGYLYVYGLGGAKDTKAAIPWLLKSAYAGHIGAQRELATLYWNGEGVEKSASESYAWVLVAEGAEEAATGDFGKFVHRHIQADDVADGGVRSVEIRRAIQVQREAYLKK